MQTEGLTQSPVRARVPPTDRNSCPAGASSSSFLIPRVTNAKTEHAS
jgi:hypothetical protein